MGDSKSVTDLRKCVIIVAGLSADYEKECRMLENNPDGFNRSEIERVIGNQYSRFLRRQQDSKAMSVSKGSVTADRDKGKNRRPRPKFEGNCYRCGKEGHRAVDCKSTKKNISGATHKKKKMDSNGRCYICELSLIHI